MKTLAAEPCRTELLRRLRALGPERAPSWGRMSAHQMVCHLIDSCRMALGEKPVSHSSGPLQRTVLKWAALYLPRRWPPGIPTRPELDQELAGTPPGDFPAAVAELETLVELMTTRARDFDWPAHPIFGRMSEARWLRWAYLHMDHHLRQFGA